MILSATKNRAKTAVPPHALVAQKLDAFILSVLDSASLQTFFLKKWLWPRICQELTS